MGAELYSVPELRTITSVIFPSTDTIGNNWASLPDFKLKVGCLL